MEEEDGKRKDIPMDADWLSRVVLSPLPHSRPVTTKAHRKVSVPFLSVPAHRSSPFTAAFAHLELDSICYNFKLLRQRRAIISRSAYRNLRAHDLQEAVFCAHSRDAPPTTSRHALLRLCKGGKLFIFWEAQLGIRS
jgi:hypothetical protein